MKIRIAVKKIIILAVVADTLLSGTFNSCFAGAWTEPAGKMYDSVSVHYSPAEDFTSTNLSNYLEYGLTDTLTIVNSIYFTQMKNKYRSTTSRTVTTPTGASLTDIQLGLADATVTTVETTTSTKDQSNSGMGDIEIGLKHKLAEDPLFGILSHQVMVKVPGPYNKNDELPIGDGQFDLDYSVLYGLSLWRLFPGYSSFSAGYRYRAEAPADEFHYQAEFGVDIIKRLHARIKLNGMIIMNNADKVTDQNGAPISTYQYDHQKLNSTLVYKFADQWGIELGYTTTLYGKKRNTSEGATYSVGVSYVIQ